MSGCCLRESLFMELSNEATEEILIQAFLISVTVSAGTAQIARINNVFKKELETISGLAILGIPIFFIASKINNFGWKNTALGLCKIFLIYQCTEFLNNKFSNNIYYNRLRIFYRFFTE